MTAIPPTSSVVPDQAERLAAPFAVSEVRWKPHIVKGNRALAIAYIDARAVQDRLDAVFGTGGWQDAYHVLPSGDVVCTLRVRVGKVWITKTDVGSQSDQNDDGDRLKAAFSDALKRAAVKLGIGRYLYRLDVQWVDYDEKNRRFKQVPALPQWSLPGQAATVNGNGKTIPVQAIPLPPQTPPAAPTQPPQRTQAERHALILNGYATAQIEGKIQDWLLWSRKFEFSAQQETEQAAARAAALERLTRAEAAAPAATGP